MRNVNQENITDAVLDSFANTPDPRLKVIVDSLVRHLHSFAREVKLTEGEWSKGIDYLTRVGHITDKKRQEFILLSDVLGLSMLTVCMNNERPLGCTEATVLGPFHVDGAPHYNLGDDVANGAKGAPCLVRGRVLGNNGQPVPNATLDIWQSDDDGLYDVQHPGGDQAQARGVLTSNEKGEYHFRSILAVPYAIPHDGPVGELLRASNRHPWRPAHLHFIVSAPGYKTLTTHVFRNDSDYLDSDAVFGVRESLVCDWVQKRDGSFLLEYEFVLDPAE
ncbi:intradiol ring-cleavage dioxygenase [Caballeronia sordidicola]|uniref:Catechol 1,2-dioxygenase 1 n=1 Tax=Caballeronia sordidicola TaxID=196367 RepID=A0A226WLH7_CABSO|nr:intradiol ring-cleavage dioxygenase [Caballeronia sordidicola]OXC72035.1 Catechol 1,2-dioxygenase 1 [Caballeronia sordidicola]